MFKIRPIKYHLHILGQIDQPVNMLPKLIIKLIQYKVDN